MTDNSETDVDVTSYADGVEQIAKKYGPRVMKLLDVLRVRLQDAGFRVDGLDDMSSDNYRWTFLIHRPDAPDDLDDVIDLTIELADSEWFEGTEDGVNWAFDMVHAGGQLVGGVTPYNYTPQVWVEWRSAPAVEKRWKLLERAVLGGDVAGSVQGWFDRHPRGGG